MEERETETIDADKDEEQWQRTYTPYQTAHKRNEKWKTNANASTKSFHIIVYLIYTHNYHTNIYVFIYAV